MEGILLLASPLILIFGGFYLYKAVIRVFTGKSTGAWLADKDAKRYDDQMAIAAEQHRQQVQAADRYIEKHGTGWLEGR
ncbi:hypothetical protein [Mycolicibacterium sp. PDY-3]|uniref:hypothetical protein n=1 Tax=Mycolicibacterium sp. PDY-3 TaxID=3376069 RepID=UPI0037AFC1DE